MNWRELKEIIEDGLEKNNMGDDAEIDYIDFSNTSLYGHLPEFYPDKDENNFSVF